MLAVFRARTTRVSSAVGASVLLSLTQATPPSVADEPTSTADGVTAPAPTRMKVERRVVMQAPAWVLPVQGYHLTSRFGDVSDLWAEAHTGLDFAAPSGTPIVSVADGVVTETAYDGSYGNRTIVRLSDGSEIWYCHQTAFDVQPGEQVRAGQLIGSVGETGNVTGAHLHLEVHPGGGDPVDPEVVLAAHGLHP